MELRQKGQLKMNYNITTDIKMNDKEAFKMITNAMYELYVVKNHDYGNSFSNSFGRFGIVSAAVRIGDKFNRLASLCTSNALVADESIEDTLLDLANYCIMTVIELEKRKTTIDERKLN